MKYLWSLPVLLIAIVGIIVWTSCDKQSCDPAACIGNNMGCVQGVCGCLQGYEGPNCDTYSYEKYVGNYQVSETCTSGTGNITTNQYSMYISLSNRVDLILINNFQGFGSVEAYINTNSLAIPDQSLGVTTVEGVGEYFVNQRQIKIDYQYFQGSQSGQCTLIMTKI